MIMIPKEFKPENQYLIRETNKHNDASVVSFESDEQERGIQFEKAFFNKELKTYMPHNDVEEVVGECQKRIMKKKLNESTKHIAHKK